MSSTAMAGVGGDQGGGVGGEDPSLWVRSALPKGPSSVGFPCGASSLQGRVGASHSVALSLKVEMLEKGAIEPVVDVEPGSVSESSSCPR